MSKVRAVIVSLAFILIATGVYVAQYQGSKPESSSITARPDTAERASQHIKKKAIRKKSSNHYAKRSTVKQYTGRSRVRLSIPRAPSTGSNRRLGKEMAANRGWTGQQWDCLNILWQKESGWSTRSSNSSGSAWGIPQALPGSKMASAGSDWRTNPATQIKWGLNYIDKRYGSPCKAWQHFQSRNWY